MNSAPADPQRTVGAFKHKQLTRKLFKFDLGEVGSGFVFNRTGYTVYLRVAFFGFYHSSVIHPALLLIVRSDIVFQQRYRGA